MTLTVLNINKKKQKKICTKKEVIIYQAHTTSKKDNMFTLTFHHMTYKLFENIHSPGGNIMFRLANNHGDNTW